MTVKKRTAEVLEENRGKYVSGADIASELGVTRNAVWKAVNSLKRDGYIIDAVKNKGYCLSEKSDILSENSLRKYLEPRYAANLKIYKKITSTNTVLKEMAAKGAPEGTIVISAEQTAGKGRFDRKFSSENGGIYFSILLKPDISAEKSLMITTAAAVAAAEIIEKISGKETKIKWVNDIFIGGKKVCGILTEASFGSDGKNLSYAVLGIGINVREPKDGFPDEIRNIAGAVFSEDTDVSDLRSMTAGLIINRFFELYLNFPNNDYVKEYKKRSLVIGKNVTLIKGSTKTEAFILDIDDECRLLARLNDKETITVSSGEVSLKLGADKMKKLLFVFNPHSGKGMISIHLCRICDMFTKGGYEVTVHPTQAKLDGYSYIMKRANDFDVLVCSGGDGTLNETIKAVMELKSDIPLGYIPAGTMNDFASTLMIPKDMIAATAMIIKSDYPIPVDVGSFNDEYFTYVAAFGLFTAVSYETDQQLKNSLGVMAYIIEALKTKQISGAVNEFFHMKVRYGDTVIEDDFIFGMVANSMSVGGFKGITGEDVWLDDGIFEGLLVKRPESLIDLQTTVNALIRKDFSAPCFYYFKSSEFEFISENKVPWTIDGEFGGDRTKVVIKNCHCAVKIFSGENSVTRESEEKNEGKK